jgi:Tat protein secretion system quality control protein TatD with DNase activity
VCIVIVALLANVKYEGKVVVACNIYLCVERFFLPVFVRGSVLVINTDLSQLSNLAISPDVIVMSEIGIDHQDRSPDKDWQEESFYAQINIARNHNLPLIFHIREQGDD